MRPSTWIFALATLALATAVDAAPGGVHRVNGVLADAAGKTLYTWEFDTMVGMSHSEGDCAAMWPPLIASRSAKPEAD
jgi:predicted lipoprotein with Yx(FWY)xxD motif